MFTLHIDKIIENTSGFCDIIDITAKLKAAIDGQRVQNGLAALWVAGSTAAWTTIEYEPGLVQDLKHLLEKVIPSNQRYHHDACWGDDNGFSHLRASLFGPSLAVPISAGRPLLGTWQQVVLLDFDNRPRTREIVVQIMGERE
ncbi:MAG: secondary thiamine-phosphate synthase enzyme YjbQ [Alphaproteobacteria bacterium]